MNLGGSRTRGASAAAANGDGGQHLSASSRWMHTRERREAEGKSRRAKAAAKRHEGDVWGGGKGGEGLRRKPESKKK